MTLFTVSSCGKEAPFTPNGDQEGEGRLLKNAVTVDLRADERIVRSSEGISMGDFVISIVNSSDQTVYTYKYSDMPDIVSLPAGIYTLKASYGDPDEVGIDRPHYIGESESFSVKANEITDNIGKVVCRLNKVKISIAFATVLSSSMSQDSYVEVRHGQDVNSLNLTKLHEINGNAAYFPYVEGEPLHVTFHGLVEGWNTHETKSYPAEDVKNGTHYKITFKLHTSDPNNQGDAKPGVKVDATVRSFDVERNVPTGGETILDDIERPKEDPENPDKPDVPTPSGEGPVITPQAPIDLDIVNIMKGDESDIVILNVTSSSEEGITGFTADIESPNLTPEELESVGLSSHLDLVNPGEIRDALDGLGLPVDVGGQKSVEFNISKFMPLLVIFGPNEHSFILTVTDANGTTVKTLKLKFN